MNVCMQPYASLLTCGFGEVRYDASRSEDLGMRRPGVEVMVFWGAGVRDVGFFRRLPRFDGSVRS